MRTSRNFLKIAVFLAAEASWINELPSVIKKYNHTFHNSTKKRILSMLLGKQMEKKSFQISEIIE